MPGAWQLLANSQRFPVAYLETAELFRRLDLDPDALNWQQLLSPVGPVHAADKTVSYTAADAVPGNGGNFTDAIAEAKRKLAESLGIASEKIEITIRL